MQLLRQPHGVSRASEETKHISHSLTVKPTECQCAWSIAGWGHVADIYGPPKTGTASVVIGPTMTLMLREEEQRVTQRSGRRWQILRLMNAVCKSSAREEVYWVEALPERAFGVLNN
ncbi:hypothetical protein D9C73_027106 [Collichthys lucidus]|uniref:Uncharacterized protein n=1 Tax=Collichthys lucidus TaxID=240159 RepID=A0A4U5VVT4_COLLU|nr:hypothetical protein D9C73_027106 [Collichthys lucidus]